MRIVFHAVLFGFVTALTLTSVAAGQIVPEQTRVDGIEIKPFPSTLERMTKPTMAHEKDEPLEYRIVDISETVARFAKLKAIPLKEARLETIACLGIQPRIKRVYLSSEMPTFETIDEDKLRIFARKSYFDTLPGLRAYIECGKKQVAIRCLIVSIDPKHTKRLNAFLRPDTVEVNCSKIPELQPIATADTKQPEGDYISTSTTITTNTPAVTGTMSAEKLEALIGYLNNSSAEIMMSPKIMMYPGQVGVISDTTKRPFVVGLEEVEDDLNRGSVRPVIQAIEDGVTLRLKALPQANEIKVFGDIAISEVQGVETVTFASAGDTKQKSIQIPRQRLRQIHLSSTVEPNTALLIDPNFVQQTDVKGKHGKSQSRKTIFILQTSVVTVEDE